MSDQEPAGHTQKIDETPLSVTRTNLRSEK